MEINEGAANAEEKKEQPEDIKKIKIRISVFFDGTLNNMTNIDQRLAAAPDKELTEEEKKAAIEVKKNMSQADLDKAKELYNQYVVQKPDDDNSYKGYYTNVVKMQKYFSPTPPAPYQLSLKIYVEGAGTMDKEADYTKGYAFGKGETGVEKKAQKGLSKVSFEVFRNNPNTNIIIELLTLDVFGFSRGAATARYFIHLALFGEKAVNAVKSTLKGMGYTVNKIEVCFAGLYDTVASTGYGLLIDHFSPFDYFANNTQALHLDAVTHAKEVVHLASADEHREFFSLTNILSAGGKGRQIFLPGVHSDIGGGYRDDSTENEIIFRGAKSSAENDKNELIAAGWYKESEIDIKTYREMHGKNPVFIAQTHVNRAKLSSYYSRIALHIMTKYARNNKIQLKTKLERDEDIPSELSTLDSARKKIESYVNRHDGLGAFSSKSEDWLQNDAKWLRDLRHGFFHFSARMETGHTPRFKNGRRQRLIIDG